MKRISICAVLLSTFLLSCSNEGDNSVNHESNLDLSPMGRDVSPMEDFMLYKAMIIFPRVESRNPNETRTAKSLGLISYSAFKLDEYTIDGVVYRDTGTVNDLVAGDDIYTSDALFPADPTPFDTRTLRYVASDRFTAREQMQQEFASGELARRKPPRGVWGLLYGAYELLSSCTYTYTTQGHSLLGVSCSTGCIQVNCL